MLAHTRQASRAKPEEFKKPYDGILKLCLLPEIQKI